MKDKLGDRMKEYEARYTQQKTMPGLPIIARIDGRSFSKFTKGFLSPFDEDMKCAMVAATKELVKQSMCSIGYTQSDEITLVFDGTTPRQESFFNGKIHKLNSVLASIATISFAQSIGDSKPGSLASMPVFDCRVFDVPNRAEAINAVMWREFDASKNSVSMLAHTYFTHASLQNLSSNQLQEKLWQGKGINWSDLETWKKRGTYVQRRDVECSVTDLAHIPIAHRPTGHITRSVVQELYLPKLSTITNKEEVIFEGKNYTIHQPTEIT